MMKNISKQFIIILLVFLIFGLGTVAGASEEKINTASVESYVLYLENEAQKDPRAGEILEQFKALHQHQQELLVKALQPEYYLKILEKTINAEEGETIFITIDNVDIPIITATVYDSERKTNFNILSNPKWVKVRQDTTIFGVNLTSFYMTVHFEHNGTMATTALSSSQGHHNYNPFILVSPRGAASPYISGGNAYATGSWTLGITPTGGLFYSEDLELTVRASATHQWMRMWSTLPNLNSNWVPTNNVY